MSIDSSAPIRVVHVDDDPLAHRWIRTQLADGQWARSFALESYTSIAQAIAAAQKGPRVAIFMIDIWFGEQRQGLDAIRQMKAQFVDARIIAVTGDLVAMRDSIEAGIDDFILKHASGPELGLRLYQLHHRSRLSGGPGASQPEGFTGATLRRIAGEIPAIVSSAVRSVVIQGPTGTGKEVVAKMIEAALPAATPFVSVNCAALSPTLLESELFGHVKGAFTGAVRDREGLLESAHGGWLFLDEVQCLSLNAQAALLRVLEVGTMQRVGSTKPIEVDVRVAAALNEPVAELIAAGKFRADLWQRLREIEFDLPPLNARRDEIVELARHFAAVADGGPYQVSPEAEELLKMIDWSEGNVRELRNCLRAMTVHHVDRFLTPLGIPAWALRKLRETSAKVSAPKSAELAVKLPDGDFPTFKNLCDRALVAALAALGERPEVRGLTDMARKLGMPKSTLATRLKALEESGLLTASERTALTRLERKF